MKYCSNCGAPVAMKIPPGDNLPRHVCDACSTVHYSNPKMVIGCIPEWRDQVLLCRRAIEPRYGLWTLPAGFMENGETVAQAALRETLEEAQGAGRADRDLLGAVGAAREPGAHLLPRRLIDLDFGPGTESLEVQLFPEAAIPWQEIAFRTVSTTLKHYYSDRTAGAFAFHSGEILPSR